MKMSKKVPRSGLGQLFLVALLSLLQFASQARALSANSDQVARLFKTMQESVWEGQMMKLECQEDYVIDVILALHSVSGARPAGAREQCNSTQSGGQPPPPPTLAADETKALVRSNCQGLPGCKVDLRWAPAGEFEEGGQLSEQARKLRKMILAGGNEQSHCGAGGGRLLEIVYKCRANKMKARSVCRNGRLQLECSGERRIVVISADYGGWPNETRLNERCQSSGGQKLQLTGPEPPAGPCHANQSASSAAVAARCTGRQLCSLDVRPEILGEPKCAPGQPEFLRVHYICASASYLVPGLGQHSSSNYSDTQEPGSASGELQEERAVGADRKPGLVGASSPAPAPSKPWSLAAGWLPSSLLEGADPKLRAQLERHAPLLAAVSGLTFVIFVLVKIGLHFAAVACRGRGAGKSSANKNSNSHNSKGRLSTSSSSKNSSSLSGASGVAGSDAFLIKYLPTNCASTNSSSRSSRGSTNSSSAASTTQCSMQPPKPGSANREPLLMMTSGGRNAPGSKHNSCSESCFSLDDYNSSQQRPLNSPTNSPMMINDHHEQPAAGNRQASFATTRPRLWSIYGHEQRHPSAPGYNQTMRPTRTFLGQPPVTGRCAQHAHQPGALPAAADRLLLALAGQQQLNQSNHLHYQSQQQQQPALNQIQGPAAHQTEWVLQQQQPAQASPVERLAALLAQQRRQQAELVNGAEQMPQNQCALHQPQLIFPPPAIQLELPQVNHHHHHHQQQQQLNQHNQLNQQPPANFQSEAAPPPPASINSIPSSCDN